MESLDGLNKASRTIPYDIPDSDVVFRIAWYVVGSQPGILLSEYSEAESTIYKGKVLFTGKSDGEKIITRVWVEEAQRSVEITVFGTNQQLLEEQADNIVQFLQVSLDKYKQIDEEDSARLRRALVAKTCWDRAIYHILNKACAGDIYYQIAHGREMVIKATEGDDIHPLILATSGWLTKIEKLPQNEMMPGNIATDLAKKSVQWKRETQAIISQYLTIDLAS
jgi:hypothetical protein